MQAGHEKTLTGLLTALAGANIIYGLGMLEMGMTFSMKQLLMDADIANMIHYAISGVAVNDETLAVDVTREVGYQKDFLTHRNTFNNRKIQSNPKLIDRQMRNRWEESGASSMEERAGKAAINLVDTYQPKQLADAAKTAIRQIINETEKQRKLPASVPMDY